MIVAVGSDHAGTALIDSVLDAVRQAGHTPLDLGTHSQQSSDYPDFAELVGRAIIEGRAERGVLICGSGVGICIAANKMKGIYAAICHDTYSAHQGVEHDKMNVLCLGGRIIGSELAKELVMVFLSAQFITQDRFIRRADKVKLLENQTGG